MQNDKILVNGSIWTGTDHVESVAIRNGRVLANGSLAAMRELSSNAEEIDLGGRRAIPGLIDSHIHFLRAGLSWNDIVRWDDVTSLRDGLDRIENAAKSSPAGTWLRVLGGWHPGNFAEGEGPTQADLDRVAPNHPVYVQLLYEEALLNSTAAAMALPETDPPGGSIERHSDGTPTGKIRGGGAFGMVLSQVPAGSRAEQIASTKAHMRDLNACGLVAVTDPGGFGVQAESYRPLFDVWRAQEMTVRGRLYRVPPTRGKEVEEIKELIRYIEPGFGDDMLRYVGLGEILTFGCHDLEGVGPFEVSDQAKIDLDLITRDLQEANWPIHMHAVLDTTISAILDVWEAIADDIGLHTRMSMAHVEPISQTNLARVKKLGIGLAIQDRMIFRMADSTAFWGEVVGGSAPPLRDILDLGIPLGAGTDATVVASHDPWHSIWWLVTGKSVDGAPPRAERHRLTIEEAIAAYTSGAAWFSLDEHHQGTLAPGMLADVAVLTDDVFAIDGDALKAVSADMTMVGGEVVYTSDAF